MTQNIRVVLAEPISLNLDGLAAILQTAEGIAVVGLARDAQGLKDAVQKALPDVVVSQSGIARLSGDLGGIPVVAITDATDAGAPAAAFAAVSRSGGGARVVEAIRAAKEGKPWRPPPSPTPRGRDLSARETEIAGMIGQGRSNRDIAQRLGLTEQSIKNLVSKILKKRGYTSRVQIAVEQWSGSP